MMMMIVIQKISLQTKFAGRNPKKWDINHIHTLSAQAKQKRKQKILWKDFITKK